MYIFKISIYYIYYTYNSLNIDGSKFEMPTVFDEKLFHRELHIAVIPGC